MRGKATPRLPSSSGIWRRKKASGGVEGRLCDSEQYPPLPKQPPPQFKKRDAHIEKRPDASSTNIGKKSNDAIEKPESTKSMPLDEKPYKCEICGMRFKKVAHVAVHSRTHKNDSRVETESLRLNSTEKVHTNSIEFEEKDTQWVEEFAQGLIKLARESAFSQDVGKQKQFRIQEKQSAIIQSQDQSGHTSERRHLMHSNSAPPPPSHPPPKFVSQLSKSESAIDPLNQPIRRLETKIANVIKQRKEAINFRLVEKRCVELQEHDWKLKQIQEEMKNIRETTDLFCDSRTLSHSGRLQRWPREELMDKLIIKERDIKFNLRRIAAKIHAEEDENEEYGIHTQRILEEKLKLLKDKNEMSKNPSKKTESKSESLADKIGHEALMCHVSQRNPAKAEELYLRALEMNPKHSTNLGNYALFLQHWKKDAEMADEMYRNAITQDPDHANNLANYASFLKNVKNDVDRAEQYYERAVRVAPNHAANLGNYATFLFRVRGEHARAQKLFLQSIKLNPKHANNLCNYASLLKKVFKKFDEAESLYERALLIEPDNPTILSNFANLLKKKCNSSSRPDEIQTKDLSKAKILYLRALEADPSHFMAKRNYAIFLRDFPAMRDLRDSKDRPHSSKPVVRTSNIDMAPLAPSPRSPLGIQLQTLIE